MAGALKSLVDRKSYSGKIREVFGTNSRASVSVGVFGAKGDAEHKMPEPKKGESRAEPLTVEDVAKINEFGIGVPERSFIRSTYDQFIEQWRAMFFALMSRAIAESARTGKQLDDHVRRKILQRMGLVMQAAMQGRIAAGDISPPNAPSTIARKGSSTPLEDTGQLRSSITIEIDLGAGESESTE